jgi:hypothetical protein
VQHRQALVRGLKKRGKKGPMRDGILAGKARGRPSTTAAADERQPTPAPDAGAG